MFLIAVPIAAFSPVSVPLFPTVTRVTASCRFVKFIYVFTMCDMAPESTIKVLLSYF